MIDYILNKKCEVRKHYISTDYYAVIGACIYLWICYSGKLLPTLLISQILYVLLSGYTLTRALAKKNRGMIGSGFLTSEFQCLIVQYYWLLSRFMRKELDPKWTAYLLIGVVLVYCFSRSYCKKMEARTTTIL